MAAVLPAVTGVVGSVKSSLAHKWKKGRGQQAHTTSTNPNQLSLAEQSWLPQEEIALEKAQSAL